MQLEPLGKIQSCFKEKFSTPRQSGLAPSANARLVISKAFCNWDAFKDLQEIDFIWLVFGFHLNAIGNNTQGDVKKWQPTVRPPRLGGNQRLSVFATRSPYRPNPIGLSLVKLSELQFKNGEVTLLINGHDLVEGTPVFDIKPYHPQADTPWENYQNGWIDNAVNTVLPVHFQVRDEILEQLINDKLKQKIIEILQLDPRPRYHNDEMRVYGNLIDNVNVQWRVSANQVIIVDIKKV